MYIITYILIIIVDVINILVISSYAVNLQCSSGKSTTKSRITKGHRIEATGWSLTEPRCLVRSLYHRSIDIFSN